LLNYYLIIRLKKWYRAVEISPQQEELRRENKSYYAKWEREEKKLQRKETEQKRKPRDFQKKFYFIVCLHLSHLAKTNKNP
jgi:hypothetical protein